MDAALRATLAEVNAEVAKTLSTIAELDAHIRHVQSGPQPTAKNNLAMRTRRVGIDQVADQVDGELNQELKVVDDCLLLLGDAREKAAAELAELKSTVALLEADLQSKAKAEHIDHRTHNLAAGIASMGVFTQTVNHAPPGTVVPDSWFEESDGNLDRAERRVADSKAFNASIQDLIIEYHRALSNQMDATARAFQARINEVDAARLKDEANIISTTEEIGAQQANIKQLTLSIAGKHQPLQLATTRLSTRETRAGIERTTDAAHHSLVDEAEALDSAITMLEQRLQDANESLQSLVETLRDLRSDLRSKVDAIRIEKACVKFRQHSAQTNRLKPGSIAF